MNRCIRDPNVQWCERRTSSLTGGEAVYSIIGFAFTVTPNKIPLQVKIKHRNHCFVLVKVLNTESMVAIFVLVVWCISFCC